jgi:hypothetical protein
MALPPKMGTGRIGLHLLSAIDQTLLRRWDALFLFDALLYALDLSGKITLAFLL